MAKLGGWTESPSGAPTRFKLGAGQACRIAMLDQKPEVERAHYIGGHYACLGEQCPFCHSGTEVADWKLRYAAYILVYTQDMSGRPVPGADGHYDGVITAFSYSHDKHTQFIQLARMCGDPVNYDIVLMCQEEQFQRYQIFPDNSGAPLWTRDDQLKAKVIAEYAKLPKDLSQKCARKVGFEEAQMLLAKSGMRRSMTPGMMAPGFGMGGGVPQGFQPPGMAVPGHFSPPAVPATMPPAVAPPASPPAPPAASPVPAAPTPNLSEPAATTLPGPMAAPPATPGPVAAPPAAAPPAAAPPVAPAQTPQQARAAIDALMHLPTPPSTE